MAEYELDTQDFEQPAGNKGVYAKFYYRPEQNESKTMEAGRPIFDDVEYIEIMTPGDAKDIRRRPVRDADKMRFRDAYRKFREGDIEQMSGTPLTEITWINASMREELHYLKCRTVEQLAELNDQACGRTPGLYDLKRKAGEWLKKSNDSAPFLALNKKNEELQAESVALKERLDQMERQMNEKAAKPEKTKAA
jgi:hypothetical protein